MGVDKTKTDDMMKAISQLGCRMEWKKYIVKSNKECFVMKTKVDLTVVKKQVRVDCLSLLATCKKSDAICSYGVLLHHS